MGIWGDEAGNLDFGPKGSRYFVVCTIAIDDPEVAAQLLDLRRRLQRLGFELPDGFHASEDPQAVRDETFDLLRSRSIRADATLFRKDRAYPTITQRSDRDDYLFKLAWFYHYKHVLPTVIEDGADPFIGVATLGTKKRRSLHAAALNEVLSQVLGRQRVTCAHWSAASDPCLQAADYYAWAIQRWYERDDARSINLVRHQFATIYSIWE